MCHSRTATFRREEADGKRYVTQSSRMTITKKRILSLNVTAFVDTFGTIIHDLMNNSGRVGIKILYLQIHVAVTRVMGATYTCIFLF